MKHFLTIILFLFILTPAYPQSGWIVTTLGNQNLNRINFINNTTGYIIVQDGNIYKTTNMGINWILINTGINETARNGFFTNSTLGTLSTLGKIYITTNGGVNWSFSFTPGNGLVGHGMTKMINSLTGYSAGSDVYPFPGPPCCFDGVFFKTTNGGANWNIILRSEAQPIAEFHYLTEDSISVLSHSKIFYTTNGGNNWTNIGFFMNPFVSGDSYTNPYEDTIFIAGTTGGILRSVNSGTNWSYSLMPAQTGGLYKIKFINCKTGYAVGSNGKIFYTTNAGENWSLQVSNTIQKLNDIYILNKDTIFIAGDSGKVLRTYTGGLTSISQNNNTMPQIFTLEQNYPNPFNNETIINYELRTASGIRLTVYDIKGMLIKTLINRKQQAGRYRISFNAGELPSGLYFYKLETEGSAEIKKMLLIK